MGNSEEDVEQEPVLVHEIVVKFSFKGLLKTALLWCNPTQTKNSQEIESTCASILLQASIELVSGPVVNLDRVVADGEEGPTTHFSFAGEGSLTVDETLVRQWAEKKGVQCIKLRADIQEPPENGSPADMKVVQGELGFDTSFLLIGDREVEQQWPGSYYRMPDNLEYLESFCAIAKIISKPGDAASEHNTPNGPLFMTPALTKKLNPVVLRPLQAENLPDSPATKEILDAQGLPVTLNYQLTDQAPKELHTGQSSEWASLNLEEPSLAMNVRNCIFGRSDIYLMEDFEPNHLLTHSRSKRLEIEIYDRRSRPEEVGLVTANTTESDPLESPEDGAAVSDVDPQEEGSVCGLVSVSLMDLFRGSVRMDVDANVIPRSTIRGAGSLQWHSRPGIYLQAQSTLSLLIRLAIPLTHMDSALCLQSPFSRCVFSLDALDIELFQSIEEVVRFQNGCALNLVKDANKITGHEHQEQMTNMTLGEIRGMVRGSITPHTIQSLSTRKLSDNQAASHTLDLLTGFHVISGTERLIVVEGLADHGMKLIRTLARVAMQERNSTKIDDKNLGKRKILFNDQIRYPARQYSALGVNLWIMKLKSPLQAILSDGHTFAGPDAAFAECSEGLLCLQALRDVKWSRQAHDFMKFPTTDMLKRIDRKFGGLLTKEEENGLVSAGWDANSNLKGVQDHRESHEDLEEAQRAMTKKVERKKTLGTTHEKYGLAKRDAEMVRSRRNFIAENIEHLDDFMARSKIIKTEWLTWNQYHSGPSTSFDDLQHSIAKHTSSEMETKFMWPYPRDPKTFNQHPKRPSEARIKDLAEPWIEGELLSELPSSDSQTSLADFVVRFHPTGVFSKDPSFFKSVHLCGDSLEEERQATIRAASEEWQSKMVVRDKNLRFVRTVRCKPNQTDRKEKLLKDKPQKLGLRVAHSEPEPCSMFLDDKYEEPIKQIQRQDQSNLFIANEDFVTKVSRTSKLHRRPIGRAHTVPAIHN